MWQKLQFGFWGRCPQCGKTSIFIKGSIFKSQCEVCLHSILENQGDLWALLLILDRTLLILPIVVMLFFGWYRDFPVLYYTTIVVLTIIFLISQKNRMGLCLAIYQIMNTQKQS